ncbi:MAG: ion channel protein, partial [Chloroflexota bacterium]
MLPLVIPGVVVGIASAVLLIGLTVVAGWLEDLLWEGLPTSLGLAADSPAWTIAVLTLAGVAVGLVVTFAPGHAGPD